MTYSAGETITITIGEHVYETPPIPDKKDILFHDKKKADQYWTRQTDFRKIFFEWHNESHSLGDGVELDCEVTKYHPDTGELIQLSKDDTTYIFGIPERDGVEGLQRREHRRCTEGVWFYNNGVPTYLTGNHYFILQWGAMLGCKNWVEVGSRYGQYYRFQRDMAYYWEICKVTPYGKGGLFMKPKKTGATQFFSLVCLNEAKTHREKNVRMMSIAETLAKESNFGLIIYAMEKLPALLIPTRSKQNLGEVLFGPPNSARNPLKKRKKSEDEPLHTWLCTVATATHSFDSFTNYIALIDEFPKIKESTYPKELFTTTLVTVMEGFKRWGTIFGMSYAPEKSDRSFYEAKEMYYNSKLKTRQRNEAGDYYGETKSELICHTLTVQEGMFGCCDVYGAPIADKIWAEINADLDKVKDNPEKIQSTKRQYPTSEDDPWQDGAGGDTLFDNMRIGLKINQLLDDQSVGVFPYIDFNLEYASEPVKRKLGTEYDFPSTIIMKPVTKDEKRAGKQNGKFKWYRPEWTPDWFMNRHVNRVAINPKTGLLQPDFNSPFFISIDPTNYKSKKYTGQGSLNSIQAFILPNAGLDAAIGEVVTNKRLFIEYLYRAEQPSETMHDIIKIILYLGCMVQIEGNMPTWGETMIEMGLGHFLLMLNKDTGAFEPWNPHRKQMFFTSQAATAGKYVKAGKEHYGQSILEGHIDNIKNIDSIDVLTQLSRFNIENTTEFDAAVCHLEGIMCIDALLGYRRAEEERKMRRGDGLMGKAARGLLK